DRPYRGERATWKNTSIFLDGGVSLTQTELHRPTTVRVRVSNDSEADIQDVTVDVYVMKPHIGVARPAQAIRTLTRFAPVIKFDPVDENIVDCIEADGTPWEPSKADLMETSNGHLCLRVHCHHAKAEDELNKR